MKKLLTLFITAIFMAPVCVSAPVATESTYSSDSSQGVHFRVNQRLSSRDGRELYLYTSGRAELYENDRMVDECEYEVYGNEIRLIKYGRVAYKASFKYQSDRKTISWLKLQGTEFTQKH